MYFSIVRTTSLGHIMIFLKEIGLFAFHLSKSNFSFQLFNKKNNLIFKTFLNIFKPINRGEKLFFEKL